MTTYNTSYQLWYCLVSCKQTAGENRTTLVNLLHDFPKRTFREKQANSTYFNFSHDQQPINNFT